MATLQPHVRDEYRLNDPAELAALLRDIWERRASVDELGRGYDVHLDSALCERIRRALGETR